MSMVPNSMIKLICFKTKKNIELFLYRPGREFAEHKINSPASCFATNSNLLAVGSWNTTINLFNINEMGCYKSIGKMHGHSGEISVFL